MRTNCCSDRRGGGGVPTEGGVPAWGVPTQGVYLPEGCTYQGVYLPGGCGVSQPGADTPPMNRITHACENITLPQLCCGR